jgi:hypothetical protein
MSNDQSTSLLPWREIHISRERERPSEPTGQAGALVGASNLYKMFSSDFIIVIENPANGNRILSWLLKKLVHSIR